MKYLIEQQKTIAISRFTLPAVILTSVTLWLMLAPEEDWKPVLIGMVLPAGSIYLIDRLNQTHTLLRNSSRMHSCAAIIMMTTIGALHPLSIGQVLMFLYVVSCGSLFKTILNPSPFHTFNIFALMSTVSLIFPEILLSAPLYWLSQMYIKGFSFRSLAASLVAIIMPYWLYFGYFVYYDDYASFFLEIKNMAYLQYPDYSVLQIEDIVRFAYVVLILFVGIIDFNINRFKDTAIIRVIYSTFTGHSFFWLLCIALQPQYLYEFMPMLIVDAAMIGGHYFALTHTKISVVINILLIILTVLVFFLPYII